MLEFLEQLRETYDTGPMVVVGALIVGGLFGVVAEISRYCMRASVAEHVGQQSQDKPRSRTLQVLFALLVALAGTQLLHANGLIDLGSAIHWSVSIKPLALIVGGGLFGIGMVLAGGCGQSPSGFGGLRQCSFMDHVADYRTRRIRDIAGSVVLSAYLVGIVVGY